MGSSPVPISVAIPVSSFRFSHSSPSTRPQRRQRSNCDPVYQTQRIGIEQYRFDVPAGIYEIAFHFAELTGTSSESLPYNLDGGDDKPSRARNRTFGIKVNENSIMDPIHLARDYGSFRAVKIKTEVIVDADESLSIDFVPVKEEPVLNAIELNRKL